MKRVIAVIAVVVLVVSLVSLAFAADKMNGNIKSIDAQAGTIVFTNHDKKDITLSVDKSIDLGKWKAGDKVIIKVEKDTITNMKKDIGGGC